MKLGIIGLDSSHAVQFSRILNGEREPFHIGGHPVTAAYPGPVSQDFDMSRDRMENFTREVAGDWGVKLYSSIAEVMKNSDAVFLEQVDAGGWSSFRRWSALGSQSMSINRLH